MDGSLILFNILNPPVLFFFLGMLAVFFKSDLEIPQPLPKLFSLYLLMAIGFKGGYELAESGINNQIALTLIASVVMACIVPIYTFFILKIKLDSANAAAIAAAYGSISAVTFITASSFLEKLHISYGGHMVAALALMESPAIVVGLILVRVFKEKNGEEEAFSWSKVLHEAFLNGSVFLLVGSVVVGMLTGEKGYLTLNGNATDESILQKAGIDKARVLATVLPDDALNVFITLTARELSPQLYIIARGEYPSTEKKLKLAGADDYLKKPFGMQEFMARVEVLTLFVSGAILDVSFILLGIILS